MATIWYNGPIRSDISTWLLIPIRNIYGTSFYAFIVRSDWFRYISSCKRKLHLCKIVWQKTERKVCIQADRRAGLYRPGCRYWSGTYIYIYLMALPSMRFTWYCSPIRLFLYFKYNLFSLSIHCSNLYDNQISCVMPGSFEHLNSLTSL